MTDGRNANETAGIDSSNARTESEVVLEPTVHVTRGEKRINRILGEVCTFLLCFKKAVS
jgi:hypothetical protein